MKALLFFISLSLILPTFYSVEKYQITGNIQDENMDALIGASILIKNTAQGTISDFDGNFTLATSDSCVLVQVSYVGYITKEATICYGQQNIIRVESEKQLLSEVVVISSGEERRKERKRYRNAKAYSPAPAGVARQAISHDPQSNSESYAGINENTFKSANTAPQSTFSIDVDAASYSNIRRFINQKQLPPKDAVRIEEMINYFNYSYPLPTDDTPFAVETEITPCPWQPEHLLLQVGIQGQKIPHTDIPASNLVFLLDVSGSMGSPDKLPLLAESLKMLTNNLREDDKISIVVYAGAAGLVLEPTSGNNKAKIREALDQLRSGGSTAGAAGIELAYKIAAEQFIQDGNNRVILATDGDFNVGTSSNEALVELIEEKRKTGVFLSVLGFGTGNYQDDKMEALADKGNGNYAYIDNLNEARKVLVTEFGGTLFTIAKDVKIQIDFNSDHVQAYRLIGYENRLLNNADFADDTKDAGELGAGHSVTALYEIIPNKIQTDINVSTDTIPAVDYSSLDATELARVKLRYKAPKEDKSQLLETKIDHLYIQDWGQCSNNIRWAATVAEFGMLLRNSTYKGNATFEHCKDIAKNAIGRDPFGYRQEMIELIGKSEGLSKGVVAEE